MNDNASYFKQAYYDQKENAIQHCMICGNDKTLGIDIKANAAHPVYICRKKTETGLPCDVAYCSVHVATWRDEVDTATMADTATNKINKRSRNTVVPMNRFKY